MMYFIDLESIPTRYSTQWREWIPEMYGKECLTISGRDYEGTTEGGFFDFNSTNIYKAEQVECLAIFFKNNKIKDGDTFFFYDVWHPGVISLKYMIDLSGFKNCKIYGILHAGAYDPTDILGMKGLGEWADGFEQSLIKACEKVFVATKYHKTMFETARGVRVYNTGLPFNFKEMDKYQIPLEEKENIIVFPHRLSPDKQPEIFDKLSRFFPDYEFIKTGELNLSKDEYYKLLARSKFQFSASLHENWGISVFESMYLGCVPILPDRCSYKEMYGGRVELYPSRWTANNGNSIRIDNLVQFIKDQIKYYLLHYENNNYIIKDVVNKFCNWDNIEKEL